MNNNVLLSLAMSIIPMLAIGFVVLLIIYKIYIKIRSRFNVTVNCWFCNQNTKVPYLDANSWTCPSCEQYNGFDKDGDYNREIYEQLDCSRNSERFNVSQPSAGAIQQTTQNGFCEMCNEAQRLKVEKLAQFEPKNESHWDEELKVYKAQLEEQYRLCSTCDRHLNKVLREKKKMVLGSKFLDFIIKGAETLKQPHLNQIQHANQQKRKQRLRTLITILTLVNISCLFTTLPASLNKEHFTHILGESLGHQIFLITSHIIALTKVMGSYFVAIREHAVVTKISLFSRTLFMMIMYSLGLKVSHFNFSSLYISVCPFAVLALAFMHNVVDGFRLTRYTAMMVVWSLFAGGLIEENWLSFTPHMLMFFTSLFTCLMAYSSKPEPSPKLHDNTANSFHKIYSEDYLSDEETMSMLSQQLNGSCVSMRSVRSNKSFRAPSPLMHANTKRSPRLTKSPLTSSAFSLHQLPRTQLSPNSSFRSYAGEENQTLRANFATPMAAMPVTARPGLFASNLELNCRERPQSTIFGMNASVANSTVLNNSFTENSKSHFANSTHANEASFYTAANNTANTSMFVNNSTFVAPSSQSGLHSPFSVSSSAVYHHQQPHNQRPNTHHKLLSPTRFSTNNLNSSSNASWLSGGYFNQRQSMADIPRNGLIIPTAQTQSLITPMEECLSRSSSHSSGFESQNGRLNGNNMSRENSLCPDFSLDYHQRTLTHENVNSFQPIDSPGLGLFSPRPSLLSSPNLNSFPLEHSDIWKQPNFTRKSYNSNNNNTNTNFSRNSIDSFNLRKINEELPSIKRGDLLKKWKEGQTIS